MVDIRTATVQRILGLCQERGLTVHALARLAAVPPSTLKNIVHGGSQNPGIVTLKKLCDALEISINDFFDHQLFAHLESEIK